jgi:hypothetical protein
VYAWLIVDGPQNQYFQDLNHTGSELNSGTARAGNSFGGLKEATISFLIFYFFVKKIFYHVITNTRQLPNQIYLGLKY